MVSMQKPIRCDGLFALRVLPAWGWPLREFGGFGVSVGKTPSVNEGQSVFDTRAVIALNLAYVQAIPGTSAQHVLAMIA